MYDRITLYTNINVVQYLFLLFYYSERYSVQYFDVYCTFIAIRNVY